MSARIGGGDLEGNPRLRTAVAAAKAVNMPKDNIEKAILKGTGALPGVTYEEVTYEGYGPSGVAFFVETLTDNKNRTLPEIRHMFSKHGGNLGETNSVGWMFEKRGCIFVGSDQVSDEDQTAGDRAGRRRRRHDVEEEGDWSIVTAPEAHAKVAEALTAAGITPQRSAIEMARQQHRPAAMRTRPARFSTWWRAWRSTRTSRTCGPISRSTTQSSNSVASSRTFAEHAAVGLARDQGAEPKL